MIRSLLPPVFLARPMRFVVPRFRHHFTMRHAIPPASSTASSSRLHLSRYRVLRVVLCSICAFLSFSSTLVCQDQELATKELQFVREVLPVLQAKCLACHGQDEEDIQGDLDLRSRAAMMRGGISGLPAIEAGEPHASPLYLASRRDHDEWAAMPPKENDRLSTKQLDAIKTWIEAGATWPAKDRIAALQAELNRAWSNADGEKVATSGGLSDAWTERRYDPQDLWAYRPLKPIAVPEQLVANAADEVAHRTKSHPIDAFLQQRLAEAKLKPAPRANRRTLIRRATFDLTGLPPSPAEVTEFLADPADDQTSFMRVVERLLASPHYGEQWGRHWLDVTRYADSSGYANDYERGNAWRYRDYVIRAFNHDKPYDDFIREQIAGDELDASNPEYLIATGFLRMGPWELTGMEVPKVARQRFLDDVTDAVGQVFLGHMLQCARCHDHKFDPVPTRDYYAMQAVFATTQLAEREASFLEEENTSGFEEQRYLDQRQQFYQQTLNAVNAKRTPAAARQWYVEQGLDSQAFDDTLQRQQLDDAAPHVALDRVRRQMAKDGVHPDLIPPRHVGFEPRDFGLERIARKGTERLAWRKDRYRPITLSVYSGRTPELKSVYRPLRMPDAPLEQGTLEQTCILAGGDPFSPTQPVKPGFLSAVEGIGDPAADVARLPDEASHEFVSQRDEEVAPAEQQVTPIEGRRLALANWIADPQNPLTARVMVNRIWQWHFNQAIAGNPNNFGATGKKPTHPELLDWLALQFIDSGWSIKHMHRLMMSSEAYQRSSHHPEPEEVATKDPLGQRYAAFKPRRLAAEEIRDTTLAVTGELNPELGGIPVRPEMNLEAALQSRMVMGTFAEAWQPSVKPAQRHRRTIYALRLRGLRDPFSEVFNAPNPDLSCEARETSTVTPQVFALFNSELSYSRALAMAQRSVKDTLPATLIDEQELELDHEAQQLVLQRLFRLAYQRDATAREMQLCQQHWQAMRERHEELQFEPPSYPQEVVREAVEENTGVKFTYTEPLEAYEDFVPDLQPHQVGPELRGLAEVCLVILNSNEFVYVE